LTTSKKVSITEKMKKWAIDMTEKHKKGQRFDPNTDKRNSVYIGYLGEAVFWCEFGEKAEHINIGGYDFLLDEAKLEIKTWWSKHEPMPDYFLKIPKTDCSRIDPKAIYCFICVNTVDNCAWIVGFMSVSEFKEIRVLREGGKNQQGSDFRYTTDCYEIQAKCLRVAW